MDKIEGHIRIDLFPGNSAGQHVKLTSKRPVHAAKLLVGKHPEQALSIIPLLFAVCGTAQTRAARLCMQSFEDWECKPGLEVGRDMLVLVETAKQHLLRIFLDWPVLFDLKPRNIDLAYPGQLVTAFSKALFKDGLAFGPQTEQQPDLKKYLALVDALERYLDDQVFGAALKAWMSIGDFPDLQKLIHGNDDIAAKSIGIICRKGWAATGATECKHLSELNQGTLFEKFAADDVENFIARPQWNLACHETGSLSRQFKHPLIRSSCEHYRAGLITRWLARLVELANIPRRLRELASSKHSAVGISSQASCGNQGLAQVEAARGRLIHYVKVSEGVISDYRILAPTEWNFHPEGLIVTALGNLNGKDDQETNQLGCLMINAVDPCVAYKLRIH